MWIAPDPERTDVESIWRYAINFDGYAYARKHFGLDCGDLANRRMEAYRATRQWQGTFEELRCCLFFEQRRYYHFGSAPKDEQLEAIRSLYRAICDRWSGGSFFGGSQED